MYIDIDFEDQEIAVDFVYSKDVARRQILLEGDSVRLICSPFEYDVKITKVDEPKNEGVITQVHANYGDGMDDEQIAQEQQRCYLGKVLFNKSKIASTDKGK